MKCAHCSNEAKVFVEYTNINLCRVCYQKLLFKRLKRWFRLNNVIHKNMLHIILDDGSVGAMLLQKFFKKFFSYPGIRWEVRKRITSRMKDSIIILPTTLTEESDSFIHSILSGEDYSSMLHGGKIYKPLTCFLETDILKWRKSRKAKPKFPEEDAIINEISKRRPMTRFSISKHIEKF